MRKRPFFGVDDCRDEIRSLLRRVREWLDGNEDQPDSELSLSRAEAYIVELALEEAPRAPQFERFIERLNRRAADALRSIRSHSGKERFKDAARQMGWWPPKGEKDPRKYPMPVVAWWYVALTNEEGQVLLGDEFADRFSLEEGFWNEDRCPMAGWDAIDVLVKHFRFPSRQACLKQLQRYWIGIEELRAQYVESGDRRADDLPDLGNLPYAASEPFDQ